MRQRRSSASDEDQQATARLGACIAVDIHISGVYQEYIYTHATYKTSKQRLVRQLTQLYIYI